MPKNRSAAASVRPSCFQHHIAATSAASYATIVHAGGGVTATAACGNVLIVWTAPTIHARSQPFTFATACASIGSEVSTSCAPASSIVAPTTGTTSKFASTAYGENSRNIEAVSGHVPNCVAIVSASASRIFSGSSNASSACCTSSTQSRIAPTHENESANDAPVTESGQQRAITRSAAPYAVHERDAAPARS